MVDKKQQEVIYGKEQQALIDMRRLDGIYESALPPYKNALWLDKGVAKYYRNGKWVTIIAEDVSINWGDISGKPKFASIATSGSYNDLKDKPTIPTAYVLPAATLAALGGVKMGTAVVDTDTTEAATVQTVATTLNSLLAALRVCGVLTP